VDAILICVLMVVVIIAAIIAIAMIGANASQ
jgi:hypothetical protein